MPDSKHPVGFVPLKSITAGSPDPAAAIAEIRQIYFKTTAQTIERDFDRAIDLLKSIRLPEDRQRATVFMEGMAEMRKDWKNRRRRE